MAQLMRTPNPALNQRIFQGQHVALEEAMTLNGTINKTGILLLCTIATAAWTWHGFMQTHSAVRVLPFLWIGLLGGLIFALITTFKKTWAPVTAPIYALLEGLALGGISTVFEMRFPGIAMQSVGLTFGTMFVLLLAYRALNSCDAEISFRHRRGYRRDHAFLCWGVAPWLFRRPIGVDQWFRHSGHWIQRGYRGCSSAQFGS